MFGKSLSEYVAFQKPVLLLIAAVWLLRLVLSVAGVPVGAAQIVSVTGVLALGALYYGWAVERTGFGSFKQLYGLCLVQGIYSQTLVALAIVLAIVIGRDNIYTIPEFYPPSHGTLPAAVPVDGKNLVHAIAHILGAGSIVLPIATWLLGSLVLLATRRSGRAAA
jgi:hypothetical protein